MKRLLVVAAGTIALMSGAAYAEGGCSYGKHLAKETAQSPVLAAVDETEAQRLAELKMLEEQAAADAVLEMPIVYN